MQRTYNVVIASEQVRFEELLHTAGWVRVASVVGRGHSAYQLAQTQRGMVSDDSVFVVHLLGQGAYIHTHTLHTLL